MRREMLALFPAVKGLYSQATTPELRKPPDGLLTCPNTSIAPVGDNGTVTADTKLTSTDCSTVRNVGAETRIRKVADHSVRFVIPVVPVAPRATSWIRPIGFVGWNAATVAPRTGDPAACTLTARFFAGAP